MAIFINGVAQFCVVTDTSPQFGANLDANCFDITGIGHIGFLACQDASAGVNDLDDYEEGTFIPTILDNSLNPSECQTYTTQTGTYTKIGVRVFFDIDLEILSFGCLTTSEGARVGGLPFVIGTLSGAHISDAAALAMTSGNVPSGVLSASTSYIALREWDATTGTLFFGLSEISADGVLNIQGVYEV